MKTAIRITSAISVRNSQIRKDGQLIFEEKSVLAGEFLQSAYQHTGTAYPKFYKMDGLSKLGWISAEYLLKGNASISRTDPYFAGIVLANRNASLDADLKYFKTVGAIPSPALFVYTLPNIVMGEISIRHKLKGENTFFIQDQFDAPFMEFYVKTLLNSSNLQCCICGWVEYLNESYEAVLMLVENSEKGIEFTSQNMLTYF